MKKFRELIRTRTLPITLEAPLIRGEKNLENFIHLFKEYNLGRWIIGINTLNNPLGHISTDPIILGYLIQSRLNIEAIPHISVSLENIYTLTRWLLGASLLNINNLLVLSGDLKINGNLLLKDALKIISMFRDGSIEMNGKRYVVQKKDFFLGGALLPDRVNEYKRAVQKISWGIDFFQSQVTFNSISIRSVLEKINENYYLNKRIYILTSIIPMLNIKIANILGSGALKINVDKLSKLSNKEYLSFIKNLVYDILSISDVLDKKIVLGIHLIPILWSDDVLNNIVHILGELS